MRRLFVIEHDVFNSQTLVAVGVTDERIIKWAEQTTDLVIDDAFRELIKCDGDGRTAWSGPFTMIRFNDWNSTGDEIGTLAHEAFHLAECVFRRIGIQHDQETSGEAFAYFIGHNVSEVLKGLR